MPIKSVHLEKLDIVHPAPEGGDVGGQGGNVYSLGGCDDRILSLVDGNLNCPVNDDVKALLVDDLSLLIHDIVVAYDVLSAVEVECSDAAYAHARQRFNDALCDCPGTGECGVLRVGVIGCIAQDSETHGDVGLKIVCGIHEPHERIQTGLSVLLRFRNGDLGEDSVPLLRRRLRRIGRVKED